MTRFTNDWATAEILKQYMSSVRRYSRKMGYLPGTPGGSGSRGTLDDIFDNEDAEDNDDDDDDDEDDDDDDDMAGFSDADA